MSRSNYNQNPLVSSDLNQLKQANNSMFSSGSSAYSLSNNQGSPSLFQRKEKMTGDGDDEDELDRMFNDILNDSNKSKQTNVSAKNKTE